ncbi:MAG TPA: penicillin-binding protein activator LpoB [Polyangiales bacterium]|nr:penicillin-binding protein activator LpoB [Polyangiales bacterium]
METSVHGKRFRHSHALALAAALLSTSAFGCAGPKAVRGSDTPGLDHAAMGTGLDRRDLSQMLREIVEGMRTSRVTQVWGADNNPPVSVLPIRNETSEHIDSALGALISEIETNLINNFPVRMISLESQKQLMEEIQRQQHSQGAFDPAQVASWGKQLGARYVVTGKVYSTDERAPNARRVQYYLFIRVISVETSEILFQKEAAVTKAII